MKRYILITIALLCVTQLVRSQLTINIALANRPQPWLSEWSNPINGQLIIGFMPGPIAADPNVKLRTTLADVDGTVLASSNIATARVYRLKDGINQFSIADALQLQNLVLFGKTKTLLQQTGRLAAGQYQLTVEVLNATGDVVRAKQTRLFFITSYQLPMLIAPADGADLEAQIAQNVIIFRWTSLVPSTTELPEYRVQVFEIFDGQTPMQAFRGNRPLLNELAIRGTTQYIWRTNLPMLDSTANKRLIWTVQTLDKNGAPVPSLDPTAQGRSQPAVFNIVRNAGAVKSVPAKVKSK